jgi:parvulin-like peptidyl-prolyl isomerase
MSALLQSRWLRGEAAERGIAVSNTEITTRLQQFQKQVGTKKQFAKYIKQLGFTPQQARDQVELSLLGSQIQQAVLPQTPSVPSSLVTDFYNANKTQFSQPETRDVRQIVNTSQAKVQQAKALLQKDNSAKNWQKVAAKYSTDQATSSNGGLRQGVTRGQSDPAADQQIFSAAQGALVGPFKGQSGYYLIQVDKVTPASTTPLAQVSSQIQQQLSQGLQQQAISNLRDDFIGKWTQRTFCANGYVTDMCANFTPQDACNGDDPGESGNLDKSGCAAFVASSAPVAAGKATAFPGQLAQGAPQGPVPAGGATTQPSVLGPSGAPQLPPGTVPQGTAPQGTAPQGTAPPQGTTTPSGP